MSLSLILAVLLDQWLGEPAKYHPLVFFGKLSNYCERFLRHDGQSGRTESVLGLLALILLLMPFTLAAHYLSQWSLIEVFIAPIILYLCIAPNSLKHHALAVYHALEKNQLALARDRVAMIVSRQSKQMNPEQVRQATIESVLENGADAVFAAIFWFIIAGPAGAVLYRLANTLDAMWGYKNPQYLYFGRAAAGFDDLLNWIPARLTALSYALLGNRRLAIQCWKSQANLLDSPNGGPVMTAGAGTLNIKLGGPAWYHGQLKQKPFFGGQATSCNQDILRANKLINNTLILWLSIALIINFLGETLA